MGGRLRRVLDRSGPPACRYRTPGAPILLAGETADSSVEIRVWDDGPGLEPEIAERLFERFYQGQTSREHHGGCGLGLAIVRALVEQSQGRIHIDTGPDRGTTVIVTLPLSSGQSLRQV